MCDWFNYEADTSPETTESTVVIVAEINSKVYGFIAHGVDKVHRISWQDIKPPPEIIADQSSVTGVCLMEGAIIQMIDFEKIVDSIDTINTSFSLYTSSFISFDDFDIFLFTFLFLQVHRRQ